MKPAAKLHPAQTFKAPKNILQGVPLKEVLNRDLIRLVGASIQQVFPAFYQRKFSRSALAGLDELEFTERGQQIGRALAEQLPGPFSRTAEILIAAMGPELQQTEGNGLAPFFYLPHAQVIAERGLDDFAAGMRANYELTKRFTAEFSIRPYLIAHRDTCLNRLAEWTKDANPHVRRLCSEGTRPRLPWAARLTEFQRNPRYTLPLLEALKDDDEPYVRRSVANHIGDILKDHPDVGFTLCERWLKEIGRKSTPAAKISGRKWIIRHAVRLPAKKGETRAGLLRDQAR